MGTSKETPKSVSLQIRDFALLGDLFESRVMTAAHVAALHFDGAKEMAKKRLQKLKSEGYVGERRRLVNEPAALFITRKGLNLLRAHGVLANYPAFTLPALEKRAQVSKLTIDHELEVMDVKAAFSMAMHGSPTFSVAEFCTWPRLHQFEADVLVKPDGFVRIFEKEQDDGLSEHSFFVEVDRSTETLDTLTSRAAAYLDYYKSGGFAEKQGAARSAYKDYPFRVLIVLKTAERRNNLVERLLQNLPPILTLVYVTTFAEVKSHPLGAVWTRPVDYRDTVKGTAFDVVESRRQNGYQRNTAREVFVEGNVKKRSLIAD